jgi:ABC-type glutathione transport system ATPase component
MSSIISIKNLEKTYISDSETLTVLRNLNLEVES